MGGAGLVWGFIVVVVGVVAIFLLVPLVQRYNAQRRRAEELTRSDSVSTVRYVVPQGQDPAVVMANLRHEGFEPVGDSTATEQEILVPCSSDVDRDRIRHAIAAAPTSLEGGPHPAGDDSEIRFTDE